MAGRERSAGSAGNGLATLETHSDGDWRGDPATRRLVSAAAIILSEGVDEETAGGDSVERREQLVRCSPIRSRRARDTECGE